MPRSRSKLSHLPDRWLSVDEHIPGWESHEILIRCDVIDGEPRVTDLRITAREGIDPAATALTGNRLRTLPMARLARLGVDVIMGPQKLARQLAAIARRKTPKHDPRAVTDAGQVADIYSAARRQGIAPRAEVCRRLNISTSTADRYIARARAAGLITEEDS